MILTEDHIIPSSDINEVKNSKKRGSFVGFVLLFLLLVIPVSIYFVTQMQSLGDTRSQAKGTVYTVAPAAAATPTPTPQVTNATRCNKSCNLDTDCSASGDMVCAKVNGVGSCRAASCPDTADCWCNKTVACNATCTETSQCGSGKVCAKVDGVGKCRNSECYGVDDCMCYVIGGSPTPTPTPAVRCNNTCTLDADCGGAMICVKTTTGNKCRDPQCYGVEDCLCYSLLSPTVTPTPIEEIATTYYPTATKKPTPIPTEATILLTELISPTPILTTLTSLTSSPLTITPFTDANGIAPAKLVISGTAEPDSTIEITVLPDNMKQSVLADSTGAWIYTATKALSSGFKNISFTMTTSSGAEMTKTEVCTIKGVSFPWAIVGGVAGVILIAILAFKLGQKKAQFTPPPTQPIS